ncbi:MAG: class I SAM-dependent methyltransferase [Pseudomonadota bacterium]
MLPFSFYIQASKRAYWAVDRYKHQITVEATARRMKDSVEKIIASSTPYDTSESERAYDQLAKLYSGPGEYGYGDRENWQRGISRAERIVQAIPTLTPRSQALEVGCGDGMTARALASFGITMHLTDLQDWRDPRAHELAFDAIDLAVEAIPLPGGPYDLIYSFNAFEHFPNPASVLHRMQSALRPGGYIYLDFGPLYCGPWGLHAYRMLPMPYPQFLFSEDFIDNKLRSLGIRDLGQDLDELQPLNRWRVEQFDSLWASSHCEVVLNNHYTLDSHIDLVTRFPKAFSGRGLTYADITTQGLNVLIKKPAI